VTQDPDQLSRGSASSTIDRDTDCVGVDCALVVVAVVGTLVIDIVVEKCEGEPPKLVLVLEDSELGNVEAETPVDADCEPEPGPEAVPPSLVEVGTLLKGVEDGVL
jgi:hypothetical protein